MTAQTHTVNIDVAAVDIPTMQRMSIDDYRAYLAGLLVVDYHEVLRSGPAGYPIATNREQLSALLDHLRTFAERLR